MQFELETEGSTTLHIFHVTFRVRYYNFEKRKIYYLKLHCGLCAHVTSEIPISQTSFSLSTLSEKEECHNQNENSILYCIDHITYKM